jgi:hypothetical protein
MTQLRLRSIAGTLVTTTGAWNDVLELAEEFGWCPEQAPTLYRADVGLQVTASDAGNLARSLEKFADHIARHEPTIDDCRRERILRDLTKLIGFCRDGRFRIC